MPQQIVVKITMGLEIQTEIQKRFYTCSIKIRKLRNLFLADF